MDPGRAAPATENPATSMLSQKPPEPEVLFLPLEQHHGLHISGPCRGDGLPRANWMESYESRPGPDLPACGGRIDHADGARWGRFGDRDADDTMDIMAQHVFNPDAAHKKSTTDTDTSFLKIHLILPH